MRINKYSFGTGDRFAHQGEAQLSALMTARKELGIDFTPVWNKSNREHDICHTEPIGTRQEADAAVKALGYTGQYFVDADHINMKNVDRFIACSDFFTIDVADYIGKKAPQADIEAFVKANAKYIGQLAIPGLAEPFEITEAVLRSNAEKFLFAVQEAGRIYRHIAEVKGADNFVPEVSMDEVDEAQTPIEMFLILSALAHEQVPCQTIAPKFTGRFNKGVDYQGDIKRFEKEFEEDILVIDFAVKEFGLPDNLKLSIHSGSDKFSIYPIMGRLIRKYDKGIHVKTAGTTWLEEIIGLALADPKALEMAKYIYAQAYERMEELTVPYATVIDVSKEKLPTPAVVAGWDAQTFARTMRHNQADELYNPAFRQLIHVSYKVAAELGKEYTDTLERNKDVVAQQVIENIYNRHVLRMFGK